ncbi:MAG: aldehyde ferredoxin oxidoreductase C-terminal domain-containing protein [Aromatoleum sp.]|jgi:aldehyde:ferredoxin oxidoreductase|uniref:aldehyde ferredoxin oxidoreductase C-terminal domain-containing protein n=1 Tax=Aromatoleum sp. TaxID=2307007 RepID=UPI00289449CE|nr:aldehyde ferredoxin oxidoreductase C-terminal domain-containing protein [Aromatoleum sp.]MDT3669127.1 aldehyde ferredoxin oxidoreductase C-terminal domain-containing protein [Aromatoleum sp.]
MGIRDKVEALCERLHDEPQYATQGAVLFVDLERRETRRKYLPVDVLRTFLGGRGANMYLLYNLLQEERDALDPEVPLIFGAGTLTGDMPAATRGNFTSRSPDSHAILDTNGGDYFPSFVKRHGYDHIVLYGLAPQWTLLRIAFDEVQFFDATPYVGLDNLDLPGAIERDFDCTERKDMALARITTAGENLALCSGIMGGIKAIWARGGGGAKMGSLRLKAIMVHGKPGEAPKVAELKAHNKVIGKKITSTSVIKNALKQVGTPFLYKPSRVLGALGTMNNQKTAWHETLDADNFDPYRPGMDGCFKCPVHCRNQNDMTPEGKGGWGSAALKGLKGNASYDKAQADIEHGKERTYNGIHNDGKFDQYDKGDGPEYVTVGKFGPMIGLKEPEQILRLNNILNDLGLDSASTGSAISWAMELWQRGIIDASHTGGLDLSWGNYETVEKLLFMTAKREGFGDTIADSARAVERGKYPAEALDYRMAVKGLFQSDPHDARILKAFALGLSVATRGMDHLRNRVTLEINARINDDAPFKTELYGGTVAPEPNRYEGKEIAVRRCENTFAVGDSVGMCRFNTKLFNSPTTPDPSDFAAQVSAATELDFTGEQLNEIGRNITGLERLLNFRFGLRAKDDTLPRRWFEEEIQVGPFKGEKVDPKEFNAMKARFYDVTGLNAEGVPRADWHQQLARTTTGFAVCVELPQPLPGAPEKTVVIDERVGNVIELRDALRRRFPEAQDALSDHSWNVAVNGRMVLAGERETALNDGDRVALVPIIAGG